VEATSVETALDSLRPGLSSDGFDLRIGSIDDGGVVRVILEATPDACLDCLVPDDAMVEMIEMAVRVKDDSIDHVELIKVGFDDVKGH
jgi:Fe-S cluster biogenesis protein NfuA